MSEFDEQHDDCLVVCPYCESAYQVDTENFLNEGDYEIESCDECGKNYVRETNYSVTHVARPSCEANKLQCQWETHDLRSGKQADFCKVCGRIKPLDYKKGGQQ